MKNSNSLDLNINIHNSRLQTKLYDKRDNFNFDIFKMPYRSIFHIRCFAQQCLLKYFEYGRQKNKFPEFIKSANILIGRIKKQGGLMNQCVFYSDF